jgi:carnitine 3-dehydrogenase
MSVFKNVAIIGGGTIGSSWAVFFASKGCKVNAYESLPEVRGKLLDRVDGGLRFLAENNLMAEDEVESSLKSVRIANSVPEALEDVEYVQETTTEDYAVKKSIFREMDAVANSDTILASSSSGLLMTEIQKVTQRPERCIIAHPFNPPHIIPLVEIVRGEKTSRETVEATHQFMAGLGKVPVLLNKEVPGYIANRLAAALWREAIDLVENDVASVEDVDKALCAGPGIRWALMGSHLTYHLGGGEGGLERFIETIGKKTFTPIWEDMKTWTSISGPTKSKLAEGIRREIDGKSLAELAQWRDDKLVKVLKVIYG